MNQNITFCINRNKTAMPHFGSMAEYVETPGSSNCNSSDEI